MPEDTPQCRGYDFNKGLDYDAMFRSFLTHGFQATHFGLAVEQINMMLRWRLSQEKFDPSKETEDMKDPKVRAATKCTIFMGYTSNMVSCGNREVIRFLLEHKLISAVVTTGGAIEEDIMKCYNPHYMGDFKLSGRELRLKGINRIGNLLVPNANYIKFEDWLKPILIDMLQEQKSVTKEVTLSKKEAREIVLNQENGGVFIKECPKREELEKAQLIGMDGKLVLGDIPVEKHHSTLSEHFRTHSSVTLTLIVPGVTWSPSMIIRRMGEKINNKDSCLYWAWKNDIPIFCPAITDGAVGDVVFFNSYKNPGLVIDTAKDIRMINEMAMNAHKTGMLILGGGVVKHHICNANLMRNGDSVFINTGQEFDGSDSGARPDEAISWGKIRIDAKPVKVYGDASLIFPLLVSQTFAKEVAKRSENEAKQAS
eukprot:CAMPEP_0167781766 /NCGR_PEP_ID=MMETSP0111_2-20121227/6119_1 /TAXON_ID=91324 /ORGANISM="Lotharella globosa, Strain CCCM811" /LENGTH=425 /DNA_ID=CAMNT_0007672473 /DNA_START=12 /DNA_END=1289 /DNA_ORIENTATION=+